MTDLPILAALLLATQAGTAFLTWRVMNQVAELRADMSRRYDAALMQRPRGRPPQAPLDEASPPTKRKHRKRPSLATLVQPAPAPEPAAPVDNLIHA